MQWWTDLWLKEGFASFMEYLGTAHAYPDWEMENQFVSIDSVRNLRNLLDGLSPAFTRMLTFAIQLVFGDVAGDCADSGRNGRVAPDPAAGGEPEPDQLAVRRDLVRQRSVHHPDDGRLPAPPRR